MITGIIYKAISPSNKIYYGKTGRSLNKRINEHQTKSKIENKHFYSAIRKYGIGNLEWIIIETYNRKTKESLSNILNERETYWIEKDKTYLREFGYNMTRGGEGVLGLKRVFSKEHRQKISKSKKGVKLSKEHKKNIGLAQKNRIFPEEHKQKLSEGKMGEKNPMYGKIPWNKGKKIKKLKN